MEPTLTGDGMSMKADFKATIDAGKGISGVNTAGATQGPTPRGFRSTTGKQGQNQNVQHANMQHRRDEPLRQTTLPITSRQGLWALCSEAEPRYYMT